MVYWLSGDILQTGDGQEIKHDKKLRKNLYRGGGGGVGWVSAPSLRKWAAEIRNPNKGVRVWLETFNIVEEAARAYDREVRKIRGKKVKVNIQ